MNKYFFISGNVVRCCIKNRSGRCCCDLELLPGVEVGVDPGRGLHSNPGEQGSSPPAAQLCLTLVRHMEPA